MSLRRGQILVVDDDRLAARAIVRLLASSHDVADVQSGKAALERFQAGDRFDMVLCDLMMPGMTGMDLFDEVQRSWLDIATRMIFMTGGTFTERAQRFVELVPNRCFEKPFDPQVLRTLAREFVR